MNLPVCASMLAYPAQAGATTVGHVSKHPDPPRPVSDDTTGHCALCGTSITRYGPAGKPLCDECEAKRVTPPR